MRVMTLYKKSLFVLVTAVAAVSLAYFFLVPAFAGRISVPSQIPLGPFGLRLYSLAVLAGIIAVFFVARKLAPRFGVNESDLENLVLLAVLFGLLGARAHHVISEWQFYAGNPQLIWQFWRGGLGFFGGIVGAGLAVGVYARAKNLEIFRVCDLLAIVAPLGQAIGRWGNFFNQEAYGVPTRLPWKMFISLEYRLPAYWNSDFFHPMFLYESLLDFGVFLLMLHLARKNFRRRGSLFAVYLILYSLVRFFLEPLRADANLFYGYYSNQLLALGFLLAGLGIYILSHRRAGSATPRL